MSTSQSPIPSAPLAGVASGLQAQGAWVGRRQLFVRFAGEAETATMYRADALARELVRQLSRSPYHSLSISGRDALGCADFLVATLSQAPNLPPVMIDTDGEHLGSLSQLAPWLRLVQVTLDVPIAGASRARAWGTTPERASEMIEGRAFEALGLAAELGVEHALVLVAADDARDADLVRLVEQAHSASARSSIIVHPGGAAGDRATLDRRWSQLAERVSGVHGDVRTLLRLPAPAGLR